MTPQKFEQVMKAVAKDLSSPKQLLTEIGLIGVGGVMRGAPVRTGTYRRSITSRVEGNAAYIGSAMEYARPLEYGTRYMAAQAPIGSGIQSVAGDIGRKAAEYGSKLFDKVAGG